MWHRNRKAREKIKQIGIHQAVQMRSKKRNRVRSSKKSLSYSARHSKTSTMTLSRMVSSYFEVYRLIVMRQSSDPDQAFDFLLKLEEELLMEIETQDDEYIEDYDYY